MACPSWGPWGSEVGNTHPSSLKERVSAALPGQGEAQASFLPGRRPLGKPACELQVLGGDPSVDTQELTGATSPPF